MASTSASDSSRITAQPPPGAVGQMTRPLADWVSLGRNRAELPHLRQDVDDAPGLCDSAVEEAEDEDLVVRDGFAGWWDAHVFTAVGPSNGIPDDDLVTLRDQVLDRNVKVGVSPMEPRKHLLHCPRPRDGNRQWRAVQRVRLDELVDRLGDDLGIVRVHGVTE